MVDYKTDNSDKVSVEPPVRRSGLPAISHALARFGSAFQRARDVTPPPQIDKGAKLPRRSVRAMPSGYFISFIGMVILPAFVAAVYLIFFASDQYLAEVRFAVRKSQLERGSDAQIASMLSSLSSGGGSASGGSLANQEAHIVASYLRSRAAIDDIGARIDIPAIFRRPGADFYARLTRNPTREELVDFWQGMVNSSVDGPSGVVTVMARAFRPEDAKKLVEEFIVSAEKLANQLSERARQDAVKKAEGEVRKREAQVRDALVALRNYRDKEGQISPLAAAASTAKLLSEAMSESIRLQNDYFVATRALSPNAPTLQSLKTRIEALDAQIEKLKGQLTSRSAEERSISASLVRFEELELQRLFSEKMYSMAQDSLERARLRAEQQVVYISVFVPPYLPEEARFPERFTTSILIAIALLLVWGIGALTVAAVEDHNL